MPDRVEKARKIADEMFFGPHKPECEIPTDQTMTVRYGHAVELIAAALSAAHAEPVAWRTKRHPQEIGHALTDAGMTADEWMKRGFAVEPLYTRQPSEAAIRADERAAIRKEAFEEAARIAEATKNYDDNLQRSAGALPCGERISTAIRARKP